MARTTEMRLIELMALKQDIRVVLEYLGKKGDFQFQTKGHTLDSRTSKTSVSEGNAERDIFDSLQQARIFLDVPDRTSEPCDCTVPTEENRTEAAKLLALVEDLKTRVNDALSEAKHVNEAYKEALAFSNLKASYSELEHLSFLSLRIGKIDPNLFDALKDAVGVRAVVVSLGDDKSRILAASSKKGRFALDTELKKFNFVNMDIPEDFKGIPDDILASLKKQNAESADKVATVDEERKNLRKPIRVCCFRFWGLFR
ncbi:MAG: hypothetical protein M0P01_01745 [Treponema sp.]|nr:hypothetical protein [Treponema sp.]